jgi:hypothetical protein
VLNVVIWLVFAAEAALAATDAEVLGEIRAIRARLETLEASMLRRARG